MNQWTENAIFYQIYPLGFCGCEQYHQQIQSHRILKIKEWIPHLLEMNINALYLGPIFESFEHGYDTSDYRKIDHRLGSNDDFKEVCTALHNAGIHIVLDGVFNHVGRNFWAFLDVKEHKEKSSFCSWFQNLNFSSNNPMNDGFTYDTWEGHYNLIKLNLNNEDVVQYLLESVAMWMDEFHIDGLRLDAADCIDPVFFKKLKHFCTQKNPNFWLMGEIIHGDYNRWANPSMLNSVTNYECYKGLYSSHNEKNYFEIGYSLNRQFGNNGIYSSLLLYNFVDNHDVNRLASTVRDERDLYNIYTMLYAIPGIPSIYYGSEYGIKGIKQNGSDAELRPCLYLEQLENCNTKLYHHIVKLGTIYTHSPALKHGNYEQIVLRNQQYVFLRKSTEQCIYAIFNVDENDANVDFSVSSNQLYDLLSDKAYTCSDHHITLSIPAKSSLLLVEKEDIVKCNIDSSSPASTENNPSENNPSNDIPDNQPLLPLGVYEHYKGKHYCVLYTAKHSETLEDYVVYRQLYGDGKIWIRPLSMFLEKIEVDGKKIPRFTYIKP